MLERGLDAGTAYEILSIDIADVDVGRNIGAELQTDQAEADKRIAQAKAEERRAMAVAAEQEMRARVVEAEAEVPLALAEAFPYRPARGDGLLPNGERPGRTAMRLPLALDEGSNTREHKQGSGDDPATLLDALQRGTAEQGPPYPATARCV